MSMRKCHRCAGAVEAHNYTTHQEWHEEREAEFKTLMNLIKEFTSVIKAVESQLDSERTYRLEQNG
jgi:hypothetical protein